ncbi:MAG: heterodisulfide reductase-related iron-sulfur binding cluster [Pseudomonadota bacterium]|nr:heterodisulfide reductase-related iron-sulfur binding cluster [Pseudomonadota bacterium]
MSVKEGSLGAPIRHPIDWENPEFVDENLLDDELRRVFDICHGCRRCFNLCESFPKLFDLIDDSKSGELDSVDSKDFKDVVDACTLCDMCFLTKCPYVPPHEFNLDFPHLMLRYRVLERKKNNNSFIDDQLTKTDRNGKFFSKFSNLANWSTKTSNKITRPLMEMFLKIDKEADLPKFYKDTLIKMIEADSAKIVNNSKEKVVIFPTCFVNYNNPNLGIVAKEIFQKLKIDHQFFYDVCCGMPQLEGGDIKSVTDKAKHTSSKLKHFIDQGYKVISIVPSCSLMIKYEWPLLIPESEDVKYLSDNTFDICEYLVKFINENSLSNVVKPIDEEETITLHISCHSRAQNIGQKATELLKLIPNIKLDVIERCSGHGGSWGIKKENFKMALKVGKPVSRKAVQAKNKYVVSECPLAGNHIKQGMDKIETNDAKILSHPLEIFVKSIS